MSVWGFVADLYNADVEYKFREAIKVETIKKNGNFQLIPPLLVNDKIC